MKIEIHNDGKNKYQSWEAKAVINSDHWQELSNKTFF
jgi:hypothetical protein